MFRSSFDLVHTYTVHVSHQYRDDVMCAQTNSKFVVNIVCGTLKNQAER